MKTYLSDPQVNPAVRLAVKSVWGLALGMIMFPPMVSAEAYRAHEQVLDEYCSSCHNDEQWAGGMALEYLSVDDPDQGNNLEQWENILRMTSRGEMPPPDEPRPVQETMSEFTGWLEASLDDYAAANPNPGRATLRRLNRSEYTNAVRDLLGLDIDFRDELPADDSGYGFDNIADVLTVSPTLMDRYLAVADKLSHLAVGLGSMHPGLTTYSVPKDGSIMNQGIPAYNERSSDALPLDSRGGGAFSFYAPHDGTYEISAYLNANTNNEADRLEDDRVSLRVPLTAGSHMIGMAFRRQLALDESVQTLRNSTDLVVIPVEPPEKLTLDFIVDGARVGEVQVLSYHMRERFSQANFPRDVLQIDVEGPYDVAGPGDTASRRKIFQCQPQNDVMEASCARTIISALARQAYRRPVNEDDLTPLLDIYASERENMDFKHGIAAAIQAILVSPGFLFVAEENRPDTEAGTVYKISDLELASRLALFLWSSLPDEELLNVAESGQLLNTDVLEHQVQRMLDDPKAWALTENFAGQWLYLRNLDYHKADVFLFPEFDTRLRQAMQRETEMFFASIVQENRSVLNFIDSDYTFLNQQLAEHYGIEGVTGTAFRRVMLEPESDRGGLLGQASILTVTSYGNHTSVVKRGQWILENLLATPPPPPPLDIPALQTTLQGQPLNAREQLELHRADPACASCHVKMDALGFALEQYDAIGAFRTRDAGKIIDASASLPGTDTFVGLGGLRGVLLEQREQFVAAFTEKLLTYALGRGVEAHDQPTVRAITRAAAKNDYSIRSIIMGIVQSDPFILRRTPE